MNINGLLGDEDKLSIIRELVEAGASVATVEATIGMPVSKLRKWIELGKTKPKSPYRRFFIMYRSWAAVARANAEMAQLAKNPGNWLESNTSAKVVEGDTNPIATGKTTTNIGLQVNQNVLLGALQVLIESGMSIDSALLKDQITIEQPKHAITKTEED